MKILFSDLDGTLIRHGQSISQKNIDMMKELKRQGHLIVLCTGRNIMEIKHVTEHIDFPFDYLILNNGGHILDNHFVTIYEKVIDKQVGIDILKHTTAYARLWSYFCDGHVNYGYKNGVCIDHGIENAPIIDIDFKQAYMNVDHFQIISFHQDDEGITLCKKCVQYIKKNYENFVEVCFNKHNVDVVPVACTKSTGMKTLLSLIHEKIDEIYAVGDSYNDISMIQQSDCGYTFDYADEEVKNEAKHHVHFVYEVIEDMLGGNYNELAR